MAIVNPWEQNLLLNLCVAARLKAMQLPYTTALESIHYSFQTSARRTVTMQELWSKIKEMHDAGLLL